MSDLPTAPDERRAAPDECLRCGTTLTSMGIERFRIGGTSGGWKLLFGEWAELREDMITLEILACGTCRRIELLVPMSP